MKFNFFLIGFFVIGQIQASAIFLSCFNSILMSSCTSVDWFDAVKCGNLNVLERFIRAGIDVNSLNRNGKPAITVAALHGRINVLKRLLELGTIEIPRNLLYDAIMINNPAVVNILLLDLRVDVNYSDENGSTSLQMAILFNIRNIFNCLIDNPRIDINVSDNTGSTALHIAAMWNRSEAVRKLITREDIDLNARDYSGLTALYSAISHKNTKSALILLDTPGIEINLENDIGESTLHLAIKLGQLKVVEKLITLGVSFGFVDKNNMTAMELAHRTGNEEIIDAIYAAAVGFDLK